MNKKKKILQKKNENLNILNEKKEVNKEDHVQKINEENNSPIISKNKLNENIKNENKIENLSELKKMTIKLK